MKKAVIIYAMAKYSTVIIGLFINAILSRILSPADYGIIAIVTVFITFFNLLSSMGFGAGVIQQKELTKDEADDIFSFTVWIAMFLGICFFFCAEPIAIFYDDSRLISVIRWLCISVVMNALNVIPSALMLKSEKFKTVATRMIISSGISGVAAVIVAWAGGKYYALVIQNILLISIQLIWNIYSTKVRFKYLFHFSAIKVIGNYSLYQFGYSLMLYASQNLDNMLIGKVMGNEQLAYYNKSYSVMRYPIDYIPHAITPVLHPILAKHQDDFDYIYKEYMKIIKVISLIGIFTSIFFIWEASEIILILFGSQWSLAVPTLRIFAIGIWAQLVNAFSGAIYQSTNNTKNMFISGIFHITVTLIAIVLGIWSNDTNILAIALTISWYVKFGIESYFLVKKCFRKSIRNYMKVFIPELFIFILSNSILYGVISKIQYGLLANIVIKTLVIVLVYFVFCIGFKQMKYYKLLLKKR